MAALGEAAVERKVGMTLKDADDIYDKRSTRVSEVARNLNFAGIALIWLFRSGEKASGGIPYTDWLLWPLGVFILAASFDLLQYLYASAVWGRLHRLKEIELGADSEARFLAPGWINRTATILFWAKSILTMTGCVLLICYIAPYIVRHAQSVGSWPLI
jgi:hypothetical protein